MVLIDVIVKLSNRISSIRVRSEGKYCKAFSFSYIIGGGVENFRMQNYLRYHEFVSCSKLSCVKGHRRIFFVHAEIFCSLHGAKILYSRVIVFCYFRIFLFL